MYHHIVLPAILMMSLCGLQAAAVSVPEVTADSVVTDIMLGEITVKAPKVVHKADMDVLYPSESAVKSSQNGVGLLNYLMIPTLSVNEFMGTVRTGGQDVEIRINGRKASVDQLKSVDPSTVRRVEWIDDPGVRYGNAPGVINVIVANPTAGGSLMTQAVQSLNQPWGNGYLDLKLNNGLSQWSVGVQGRYTNKIETHREYFETFTGPDGTSVTRTESPVDGYVSMTGVRPTLSYNYINPEKTTVWVGVSVNKEWPVVRSNTGLITLSDSADKILLHEKQSDKGIRPKINAYIEQQLPHSQTIAIDVDASLFNGRSSHIYRESDSDDAAILTDVSTSIRDHRENINVEGNYIRRFRDSRITAGAQYASVCSRSTRESGAVSRRREERTYVFGEYFRRFGILSLTAGAGAQYVDMKSLDSDKGTYSWSVRPRLSASFRLSDSSKLNFSLSGHTSTPSSSQTDVNIQQIDGFQYQVGNPDLRTYNTYNARLQYRFAFPRVDGLLEARWSRAPHAIAQCLFWKDDRLVTTFENSRGNTTWQISLSPQVDIIPGLLVAKGTLRYYKAHTAGTGYVHNYHSWTGEASLMATWRGFILTTSYEVNSRTLSGETITRNENTSTFNFGYSRDGLSVMAGIFMPFNRYSMGSESLNRYNSNRNILRSRGFDFMPVVQVAYNFNWGRQKKASKKLINVDDGDDRSKAAGR